MQTCTSLRDLHLKFNYTNQAATTAQFTHVKTREDYKKCIETIQNFVDKINKLANKKIGAGIALLVTDKSVTLKFIPKINGTSDEMTPKSVRNIPSLIRYVCHTMNKNVEVKIKHKTCIYNPETGRCKISS